MMRYISAVLLLQCFLQTLQVEQVVGNSTVVPGNGTEVTWRDILPDYCGYRGWRLEEKLTELQRKTRSADESGDNKVANGKYTYIAAHPWQAALVTSAEKRFKCGGSIISKHHVLTATHCFMVSKVDIVNKVAYESTAPVSYTERLVVVGFTRFAESNLVYKIKELYIHNFYSFTHRRNDIALLKIDGEFVWSKFVFPICLPAQDEAYTPGRECVISGFGDVSAFESNRLEILQYGWVTISTESHCKTENEKRFGHIAEGMFCASGNKGQGIFVDTCKGDSGGPLYCEKASEKGQRVLLGITSFGHECGLKNFPGIYTKVSKYLQWIHDRVEVSLGYGYGHRSYLPEDEDVGRPAFDPSDV